MKQWTMTRRLIGALVLLIGGIWLAGVGHRRSVGPA